MNSVIQPYDIVMLVVLIGAVLFGALKGMAWQLASLASLIVSGVVAVHGSAMFASSLPGQEPWNRFLAMFILYSVTALAIWIGFRFISGMIERVKLKEFDRQMGAMFGLAKGILLCLVITFFAVTLGESTRQLVLKSYSGDATARLLRHAYPILPEDVRSILGKYIEEMEHQLDPNTPSSNPPASGADTLPLKEWETKGKAMEQKVQETKNGIKKILNP